MNRPSCIEVRSGRQAPPCLIFARRQIDDKARRYRPCGRQRCAVEVEKGGAIGRHVLFAPPGSVGAIDRDIDAAALALSAYEALPDLRQRAMKALGKLGILFRFVKDLPRHGGVVGVGQKFDMATGSFPIRPTYHLHLPVIAATADQRLCVPSWYTA